jgi:Zn-dependent peptidase ImmA (M78 family)
MILRKWLPPELENTADEFRAAFGKYNGRALMVEETLVAAGLRIMPVPGLAQYAEAYIPIKSGFVFIDEEQYNKAENFRHRFTLAEELSHHLIHRPYFNGMTVDEIRAVQRAFTESEYLQMEYEAKHLAGAILMGKKVYQERYMRFYGEHRDRGGHHLNSIRFAVRELSQDFFVSCYSVAVRAVKVGVIDRGELDDLRGVWEAVA